MTDPRPITSEQFKYVLDVARKLNLPRRMMDDHAVRRFGCTVDKLSITQASALLDEIIPWSAGDVRDLLRAGGQTDLPGFDH